MHVIIYHFHKDSNKLKLFAHKDPHIYIVRSTYPSGKL